MLSNAGQLQAIIFDADGTLYRQDRLRLNILLRLFAAHCTKPSAGWQTLRIIRAYRAAQEALRGFQGSTDLAALQIMRTCQSTGHSRERVEQCVKQWMETEPLDLLRKELLPGLLEFLAVARSREILLGIFSDYPAMRKIEAMGIQQFFQAVVSATDPDVQEFKPGPRGLEVALQRLGVKPANALYVGDRPEADAAAAARAGVRCAILGRAAGMHKDGWVSAPTYRALQGEIFG
ncbi:MAG: HAD family hydrolase [Terriglobia bacterium]